MTESKSMFMTVIFHLTHMQANIILYYISLLYITCQIADVRNLRHTKLSVWSVKPCQFS